MDKKEPGYVYILTNPSFREDWVKIGKSSREVVDAELKYDSIMDFKEEFFVDKDDFDTWKQHNRFARFRMTGKTNSSRLNLAHLMSHGLKMAPRGALNLSYKDYEELKKYIEDNF